MSKICYVPKRFTPAHERIIETAEEIIDEYQAQGFILTLRQLYYQFVARDLLPNKQTEYKRLGGIIDDAKNAGLLPWAALEDRTRFVRKEAAWESPASIVRACAQQFHLSRWDSQKYAPRVDIEKDALVGVIEAVCKELDVPYFACRGYVSGSAQWRTGQWAQEVIESGREPIIFHLGDHDPSGLDMTRDNHAKVNLYANTDRERGFDIEVRRLALNMDQVRRYKPPPNPAKETDSRHEGYAKKFGLKSWELDALEPRVIAKIIRDSIESLIDFDEWNAVEKREAKAREKIKKIAETLEGE